ALVIAAGWGNGIGAAFDQRAAAQRGAGQGRPAVVLQRPEFRIERRGLGAGLIAAAAPVGGRDDADEAVGAGRRAGRYTQVRAVRGAVVLGDDGVVDNECWSAGR